MTMPEFTRGVVRRIAVLAVAMVACLTAASGAHAAWRQVGSPLSGHDRAAGVSCTWNCAPAVRRSPARILIGRWGDHHGDRRDLSRRSQSLQC